MSEQQRKSRRRCDFAWRFHEIRPMTHLMLGCGYRMIPATAERRRERRSIGGVTSPATAERRRERRWKVVRMHGQCWSWMQAAGETAEKTWLSQSSALGEGGCCSLSRPSDDLKIS